MEDNDISVDKNQLCCKIYASISLVLFLIKFMLMTKMMFGINGMIFGMIGMLFGMIGMMFGNRETR